MVKPSFPRLAGFLGAALLATLSVLAMRWYGDSSMAGTTAHVHKAELKNPDGSWKYTNALSRESSPYLLQHAHNPVDWYPWGKEAFELAQSTGKPIFLSVGYSTCYWCHVMERQCFEDPKIAELMNRHFVCIKVDREERPDVDDIYMAATQLMTRHGGWPMSVFLTMPGAAGSDDPGLKPFWAGTYIPPTSQHGRPSFPDVLKSLAKAWQDQRAEVLKRADQIAATVTEHLSKADPPADVGATLVQQAASQLLSTYDPQHGGFSGGGTNKFPQPSNLLFLMRVYQNNPDEDLWTVITHTLERMASGGMYDQIGGGFHRYSTDEKWLVPHFEKMLYDNAQLVDAYLIAQSIKAYPNDSDFYVRVAREICEYVLRQMTDVTGTFWSAQDAEVNAREGGSYVWLPDQVKEAVRNEELAKLASVMYGLDQGINFRDPHHPDERANVLYLPRRLDELAKVRKQSLGSLLEAKSKIDQAMLAVRDQREQPITDDKVLVSWNGMMIGAMARAGRLLNESRYLEAAQRAAQYIVEDMRSDDGGLYRTMREGKSKIPAFLDDYAFFVHGLIELNQATGDRRYVDSAEDLMRIAIEKFGSESGGYFDTLTGQSDLFVRTRTTYDGAVPTGNSQMVHNLIGLYELTRDVGYLDRAVADLRSFGGAMRQMGQGMVHMHHALLRAIEAAPLRFVEKLTTDVSDTAPNVLSATVEPQVVDLSGGSASVTVTVKIHPDYHINAHDVSQDGLIPTTLALVGSEALPMKVEYPAGEERTYTDQPLHVYDGTTSFKATIRKTGPVASNANVQLLLRYQACTKEACLRPENIHVPVSFKGLD